MENTIQEFCVEARKGKLFANEWQPIGTAPSLDAALDERRYWESRGYEARVMVREMTPWRELSDTSDSKASV